MQEQNNSSKLNQEKQEQEIMTKDQISCNKFSFLFPLIIGFMACLGVYYFLDKNLIIIFCILFVALIFSKEYWKLARNPEYKKEAEKRGQEVIKKPYYKINAIGTDPETLLFISFGFLLIFTYWFFTNQIEFRFFLIPLFLVFILGSQALINLSISKLNYFSGRTLFRRYFVWEIIFWVSTFTVLHYKSSIYL